MTPKPILPRLALTLTLAALVAGPTHAQESEAERGQLWEVVHMEVPPEKGPAYEEVIQDLVQLAGEQGVGPDYAWHYWANGFDYLMAYPMENFSAFDDPMAFVRQLGEEGGQRLEALHRRIHDEAGAKPTRIEVHEAVPGWGYEPEGGWPDSLTYAMRYTFELKPERMDAVGELAKEFVGAWEAMDYPHPISGYRTWIGEVDKVRFLFFIDDPSAFMGSESPMAVAERAGQGERYGALLEEMATYIEAMEEDLIAYRPEMSYTGASAEEE